MVPPMYAKVGQTVTYEGYADDYGRHIVALEFTFENWETFVSYDTSGSDPDLLVHWTYSYVPEEPGAYELKVRAVRDDGARSPLAAAALLYVSE